MKNDEKIIEILQERLTLLFECDNSVETKLGILIAFNLTILLFVLDKNLINEVFISLPLIVFSTGISLYALAGRSYATGIVDNEKIEKWRKKDEQSFYASCIENYKTVIRHNKKHLKEKGDLLKYALVLTGVSCIVLILSNITEFLCF